MISIITPTLNSANFIEKNILSVLELNIPYEHILVDGGSSDSTLSILKKYPHLKIIHQKEPLGMYHAIQIGFDNANGQYITWINSDDWVVKNGYEKMYYLIDNYQYDLVYGSSKYFYLKENKFISQKAKPFGKFLLRNRVFPFIQPSSIYSKTIFNEIGGFEFKKFKLIGDIDFFMRLAINSKTQIKFVSDICTIFLKYGESLGDKNHDKYLVEKQNLLSPRNGKIGYLLSKLIYKLF